MAGREIEKIVLVLVAVIVIIIVAGAVSMTFMMGGGGWGGMMGPGMMGWGSMGFSWIMLWLVIFLVILIVGVYFLITGVKRGGETPSASNSAFEIVKERYAKGEITAEEFKRMKRDLTS